MRNLPVRIVVILGALTMAAIVVVQVYWVSQAINRSEEQFRLSVQMALRNVVESLCEINGNDIPSNDPIDQLSSNYFIARTNYKIDLGSLDYLLKAELQKRSIDQDYEFGVYDCQTDQMVYGDFVSMQDGAGTNTPKGKLPVLVNDAYYFGVYFPGKSAGIFTSLGIWKLTTALTVVILIIFSYALFVILRQKRFSEMQRDFINNMTHEFKTPLATLKVSSNVLLKESSSERQKKYAGIMQTETGRLQKQVEQLLGTALLDHKQEASRELIDAREVIENLIQRVQTIPDLQISQDLDFSGVRVVGDSMLFENILFNLLENAIKYGDKQVHIIGYQEHGRLVMSITNPGTIRPKEQKRIFRKFYRIPKGDLHDVKGFGLGLYFAKKAIKTFGGDIKVQSDEREVTFTATFTCQ